MLSARNNKGIFTCLSQALHIEKKLLPLSNILQNKLLYTS